MTCPINVPAFLTLLLEQPFLLYGSKENLIKLRRTEPIALREEGEARLEEITTALRRLAARDHPPSRIDQRSFCKRCAFEELCYA